jgi:hypothetical protein
VGVREEEELEVDVRFPGGDILGLKVVGFWG